MRKKDREITDRSAMESILNGDGVCRVALADGCEPCVVPVCFLGYEGQHDLLLPGPAGKKIEMLAKNPRCCVEVDSSDGPVRSDNPCRWGDAVQKRHLHGTARILEDYREKCAAMNCIIRHYGGPEYPFSKKELSGSVS